MIKLKTIVLNYVRDRKLRHRERLVCLTKENFLDIPQHMRQVRNTKRPKGDPQISLQAADGQSGYLRVSREATYTCVKETRSIHILLMANLSQYPLQSHYVEKDTPTIFTT